MMRKQNLLIEQIAALVLERLDESSSSDQLAAELTKSLKSELGDLPGDLEDILQDVSIEQEGALTLGVSVALAVPALLGLFSKIALAVRKAVKTTLGTPTENQSKSEEFLRTLGKVADSLHHVYMTPIEKAVGVFVKDKHKAHKISSGIFHLIVGVLCYASGVGAVNAFSSNYIELGVLESALTAVKGKEVKQYVTNLFSDKRSKETAPQVQAPSKQSKQSYRNIPKAHGAPKVPRRHGAPKVPRRHGAPKVPRR